MPMRTELAAPLIGQDSWTGGRDLLAVCVFCAIGLALSFALMAYTDTFEQIADLAGAHLWG
jgi:hypothetical protein